MEMRLVVRNGTSITNTANSRLIIVYEYFLAVYTFIILLKHSNR